MADCVIATADCVIASLLSKGSRDCATRLLLQLRKGCRGKCSRHIAEAPRLRPPAFSGGELYLPQTEYQHAAQWTLHATHCALHVARCALHDARCTLQPLVPTFTISNLQDLIARMASRGIFTAATRPDSCIINYYSEGDCIPPHIDHLDFTRPFVTLSLLSEQVSE